MVDEYIIKKKLQYSGSSLMSLLVIKSQPDPYTNSRHQLIFYTTQTHFIMCHKSDRV